MHPGPIGIFDSGLGGISILNEVVKQLPEENIIYYADSVNCPYGSKSRDEIILLSENICDFLLEKGCKMIVVACNTATAGAIDHLRAKYPVPFIGIEPAIKPAALNSKSRHIGVLATEGTFNGRLFNETKEKYTAGVETHIQIGHGLVQAVEKLKINDSETRMLLQHLLAPVLAHDIDHLVLGCTHYPFLKNQIEEIISTDVRIIDPSPAVARQTKNILLKNKLACPPGRVPAYRFYTTGNQEILDKFVGSVCLMKNVKSMHI